MMIQRPEYMKKLQSWKDKQLVKILTGVRRCGKSTLFRMFQEYLLQNGVSSDQIINLNMEDPDNVELLDWLKLYNYVNERLHKDKKTYVFIDEIQNVPDFQRAADGLFIKENVDLYLTGSNSHFQSGQWATMLTGRYIEIHVLPLSFKEYVSAYPFNDNKSDIFAKYLETSGFPYALNMRDDNKFDIPAIREYMQSLYNTIVLKDIVENKHIKDVSKIERLLHFMGDQVGKITSVKRIVDILKTDGISTHPETVEGYMDAFMDSYLLYRAKKYDIKGTNILKTNDKYYAVDPGMLRLMLNKRAFTDRGHILENVVYLELLRRGYKVYVGRINKYDSKNKTNITAEVDFVAIGNNGTEYYQVAETVNTPETFEREFSALDAIKDHNPKYVLTMDQYPESDYNGIKQINIIDWLLQ